ncbi:unnamed protein product [Parascedosporium putredinis]|uniref:Uncharacterized protein n=1 Tax=Parascedosporium putredinis TaxID=1442378 RepID=A0A9P1HC06_9PEZI|nr:unnamed protein product [Parascedosporium putredinis]CAI8004240.1 unnamed protein product [Parascedosporium putredinis]
MQSEHVPKFSFQGVDAFFGKIDASAGDNITFRDVTEADFEEIHRAREQRGRKVRLSLYSRPLGTDFPTLVIEAGYSQSWASLRAKGRWWFEASDYAVKIVLLVKMDRSIAQIRIEKWKAMEQPRTRPSRATTRAMAAQVVPSVSPECVQTVDIIRAASVGDHDPRRFLPNSYRVTREWRTSAGTSRNASGLDYSNMKLRFWQTRTGCEVAPAV